MLTTSHSVGSYVTGEAAYVAWGTLTGAGAQAAIYLQGSHNTAASLKGDTTITRLAAHGFTVVCGDLSQTATQGTFGNTTVQTRVGELRTFVQGASSPRRAAAGKVHLLGASGGAAAALNYARANPANVASIYIVAPLVALQDFYENRTDASITQLEVRNAYAGAVPTYSTHDPSAAGNQAALSGIPIKIAYSTNDPYIPQTVVETYRNLVVAAGGSCALTSMGAVGHSAAGMDAGDVAAFFKANP